MGQQNTNINTNIISNWNQHPIEPDIIYNILTNEQIHRHYVVIHDPQQLTYYAMRMHQHYTYICRVVYYHPAPENIYEANPKSFFIYTERLLPITYWRNDSSLIVIKGFRKLFTNYQPFRVQLNMIGQNQRGQTKVWLHNNPTVNFPQNPAQSEEQMLADIVSILMLYDKYSASLLMGSRTFNDSIRRLTNNSYTEENGNTCRVEDQSQNSAFNNSINQPNNQFWTMRNGHDDRYFISQGKKRNPIEYQIINRNTNSSVKHSQASLGKSNYPHFGNIMYTKVCSPKVKMEKDIICNKVDNLNSNNSSINQKNQKDNKFAFAYQRNSKSPNYQPKDEVKREAEIQQKIQQRKKYATIYQRKDISSVKQQGQNIQNDQEIYTNDLYPLQKQQPIEVTQSAYYDKQIININRKKQAQAYYRAINDHQRLQTFNNINDIVKYGDNARNKTQQFDKFKGNVPSFLPKKKQNLLSTNLQQDKTQQMIDKKDQGKVFYKGSDQILGIKLEKKTSGSNLMSKKQNKTQKTKEEVNQQKEIKTQYNIGQDIKKEDKINPKFIKKQTNSQVIVQGHSRYNSNQQTKNTLTQDLPPSMTKSGGEETIKSQKKLQTKAQSMDSGSVDQTTKKIINSDTEMKKKYKQEMAQQLKKQFGEILSWNNQETINSKPSRDQSHRPRPSYQLTKNSEKYLQTKLQGVNLSKGKKHQQNSQEGKQKINIIISKCTQNIKDQIIKQKVEMKKATFAQLKSEAMKILSDDLF